MRYDIAALVPDYVRTVQFLESRVGIFIIERCGLQSCAASAGKARCFEASIGAAPPVPDGAAKPAPI
jgi:hypothetical protein